MKRFLSLWMFLLCFIGGTYADGSFTITFKDSGQESDGTSVVSTGADMISDGSSYVSTISASDAVYLGRTGRGLKLGTSKKAGTFTMALQKPVKPTKIEFYARQYNDKETSITVNGKDFTTLSANFDYCLIDYDGQTEISEISVSTPAKRAYITKIIVYYSGDLPGSEPTETQSLLIDYPTVKTGITIKTTNDSQVKYNTVKIHNNTDAVDCIQFGKSFKYTESEYYYALLETEGGFKKGDVISIAGVFNNADDTKKAAIAFYSDPTKDAIWTTEDFINGRTSASDPVAQTFTLTEDAANLYIGRSGNTGTSITKLMVQRATLPVSGDTWTVAGNNKTLFGTEWDPTNAANDMTLGADYFFNKTGVTLSKGTVEFKVVKNHSWDECYGNADGNNYVLDIPEDGVYDISIIFSPTTKTINAQANKTKDAELPDATIEKVVLLGSFNNWNTEAEGMQKVGDTYVWTTILDAKDITGEIEFKLLVNGNNWLGMANSASLAIEELGEHGPWHYGVDNIVLNHPITGYDTYTITATWTPNSNAASGWKLTIAGKDAHKEEVPVEVKEGEDIAAAVAAVADKTNANITINLTENKTYELSQPLVVNNTNNLTINGNGATIDASKIEGALFKYQAPKAEGAPRRASLKPEWEGKKATIDIKNLTINDLANTFFEYKDADNMRFDINVENVSVKIAANKVMFDVASSGGFVENLNINNSSFFAPTATTQSFFSSQAGKNGGDVYDNATDGTALQTFKFENSTFYNLAKGKNFFSLRQAGQKFLAFNMQNNIFVNCGKDGQTVKGLNGGQSSANPSWNINGNLFNFDGVDKSAAESTGDADEPVKNSVAGVVTFTDAANGDFNGTLAYEAEKALEKAPGDPRWTLALKQHYQTIWSSEEPVAITWGAGAFTIAAEKFANAEIGDNLIVKIVDPQVYTNPWDAQVALKSPRDGWPELEGFTNIGTTAPTMVTYVLTGDILAEAKKNGLLIAGNNFKTDRVSIEATSTTGSENSIWIGEQTEHLYVANCHFANASNFRGVKVNDIIRVKIKEPNWLGMAYNKGWSWTGFAEGDIETRNDYTNPVVEFVIKSENAAKEMNDKANNNGVIFNTGAGAVPLQVELIPYFDVATLNKLEDKEEFTYTNEVVVAAITKKKSATYVYIKDDSGYSLIYDKDGSKTKNLVEGKTIQAGWKGQVSIYNGLFEVVPAEPLAVTEAAAQNPDDLYLKATTLKVFKASNANKVYKIENLTLSEVNGSNFKVTRGTLEVAGYNQFDGVVIEDGLVCDEVIAAVGIYNGNVQLQPISIKANVGGDVTVNATAGGDLNEAVAKARKGKNPKTLTINLAKKDYTVSAPIVAYGDVTINGNGAKIDASELGDAFIKISAYPATTANANGVYEFDGINIDNVEVKNLKYQLIAANNGVKYLYKQVKVNKSIIAIDGTNKKSIFDFTGVGGTRSGNAEELIVSNSTMYAFPALEQAGGLYSNQQGSGVIQDLKGTKQVMTIENSTLYNISKGKNTCSQARNNQAGMAFNVKNSLIVNCGKNGQFLKGLDGGSWKDKPTWTVENSSFAFTDAETGKDKDVAENELKEAPENVVANGVVYSVPLFRKEITEGDFTLGICAQFYYKVGDPRWWDIPVPDELLAKLNKAAKLLSAAQADWQTAPAANEAIEKLAGAYNENAPYLNSYYQEEIDEATLRMEAAIAEFEMVYGSDATAIKAIDAVKADGTWYTINGQRISKPTEKGIYIHNGRKVVVK